MIRPRVRHALLRAGVALTLIIASVGLSPAHVAQAATPQPVNYTVGGDGRLYASSPSMAPMRANEAVITRPGASVSAVRQINTTVAVFTIGTQGGLLVGVSDYYSPKVTFFADGPTGLAPAGSPVSAVSGPNGVHVFFVGYGGRIYGKSYNGLVTPGGALQIVAPSGVAPDTAIAALLQPSGLPGVTFIDGNGGLRSIWLTSGNYWYPVPSSPSGLAPVGGGVAAVSVDGLYAFFTASDGRIWQVGFTPGYVPQPWKPQPVTGAAAAPAGARLSAAKYPGGSFIVNFASSDGAIWVANNAGGQWSMIQAAPAGMTVAGSPSAITLINDTLWVGWCGTGPVIIIIIIRCPCPPKPDLIRQSTGYPLLAGADISTAALG